LQPTAFSQQISLVTVWGGYVALNLAQTHPQFINKIFTLGTKLAWNPHSAEKEVKMLNPEKIEEKVPLFADALKQRHAPNNWKKVLIKTAELMRGLGENPLITPKSVRSVTNQVVIGIGEEDRMVSIEESRSIAEALPNGRLKLFENFDHPIEKVDTNLLSAELTSFFDEQL